MCTCKREVHVHQCVCTTLTTFTILLHSRSSTSYNIQYTKINIGIHVHVHVHACVNALSKNWALGTLGQFHPPIGLKCDSENVRKFTFQILQAFHRGDHNNMVFMAFLCYSGHFTYQSVPKAQFSLDMFTCAFIHAYV